MNVINYLHRALLGKPKDTSMDAKKDKPKEVTPTEKKKGQRVTK